MFALASLLRRFVSMKFRKVAMVSPPISPMTCVYGNRWIMERLKLTASKPPSGDRNNFLFLTLKNINNAFSFCKKKADSELPQGPSDGGTGMTLEFHVIHVSRTKKCAIPSNPRVLHYVC